MHVKAPLAAGWPSSLLALYNNRNNDGFFFSLSID